MFAVAKILFFLLNLQFWVLLTIQAQHISLLKGDFENLVD